MKLHINPFVRSFIFATISCAMSASFSFAASATWNSQSTGTWVTGTNWSPAAAPGATTGTTNADIATFNNIGYQTITLPGSENIGGITFATAGSSANPFLLTGGSLLPSAGAVIQTDSTYLGIAGIGAGITAQGNLTLTANGLAGSGLLIGTTITTAASLGNVTLALNGSNSGFNSYFGNLITGIISQNATGSTLKVAKSGTGTWALTNANTYTGGTDLNGGMLVTSNATALGSSGSISVLGDTTLRTTTGLTDPSARISISNAATLTFDTYNQNQTWAGQLNGGVATTGGLTKTGLGVLTITPAAGVVQTWTGKTTVNMGTLTISGASQTGNFTNLIDSGSALVLGGGNINFTGKASFTNSQTFIGTTLNAGVSGFIPAASSGTNTFDFGTITRNTGSLLDITPASGYTIKAGTMGNDAGGLVRGVLINGDFVTSSSGTLGAVTYMTQNAAGSWTSATANYVTGAAVTGSVGTATINSLKLNFAGSNSFAITGALSVNDGILFGSTIANNPSTISGGVLTGPSGGGDLIIVNNNAQNIAGRNTISSVIKDYATSDFAGAGTNGVTNLVLYSRDKAGALVISGANTYTGNTYIGGGANAQTGSALTIVGVASGASIGSTNATVFVNGGTGGSTNVLQVGNSDATGDVKGTIQLDNGKLSLKRTDTFTLSANVSGVGGGGYISQDSTGNATINFATGNNVFTSLVNNAAGTLNLTGAGSVNAFASSLSGFNAGATTNFNSGTYYFAGTGNAGNQAGTLNINGATVITAGGRYFMSAGGTLTLNSGTFQANGSAMNGQNQAAGNITYNINGGNFITTPNTNNGASASWQLGGATAGATGSVIANQTAGEVSVGLPLNTNTATNQFSALLIGGAGSIQASTYNLSGGVLRVVGGIQEAGTAGAVGAGGSNNFNWTGGRLTTSSINLNFITSNDGVNSGTGTLFQGGSTSIMAPGETFNGQLFTGKTSITGNYQIDSGAVAIGLGGTTAAGSFHDTMVKYDNLTATGTVQLGGTLNISLRSGYTPANTDTFTIVTGTGGVSGAFTNLSGGKVTLAGGATMNVAVNANTVVLSSYTAGVGTTYASWQTANGTTQTIDLDHDGDGVSNGVEYFIGGNGNTTGFTALPSVVTAGSVLSITFTHAAGYTGVYGTDYVIETSASLAAGSWSNAPGVNVTFPTSTTVKYTFTGTADKAFARLKVTGP